MCNTILCLLFIIVPSSSPTDLAVTVSSSTEVKIQWNPPPISEQNGMITEYNLSVINTDTDESITLITNLTTFNVGSLLPHTVYRCAVAAYTSVGIGPYTTDIYFETDEAGTRGRNEKFV